MPGSMLDRSLDGDDGWGDEEIGASDRLLADPSPIDPVAPLDPEQTSA
ncbi:MAG: hypothetical protein QOH68_197 [Nocardioidaceae bacterium]|jgi:hypothetical protein|nr:hypothetical protein [Nocardioidaceae bacterium]